MVAICNNCTHTKESLWGPRMRPVLSDTRFSGADILVPPSLSSIPPFKLWLADFIHVSLMHNT